VGGNERSREQRGSLEARRDKKGTRRAKVKLESQKRNGGLHTEGGNLLGTARRDVGHEGRFINRDTGPMTCSI